MTIAIQSIYNDELLVQQCMEGVIRPTLQRVKNTYHVLQNIS